MENENDTLMERTMLVCATIYVKRMAGEDWEELYRYVRHIHNATVRDYLTNALLWLHTAYVPEYLKLLLEMKYASYNLAALSDDEKRVLVALKFLVSPLYQYDDVGFFREIFSHQCSSGVKNRILERMGNLMDG